ncbi:unnamed protein product [Moneuplotes crassus]|uniref:Uncharacterized protein n=1 Tax=Euplotes crassus TaxID=5936 RepID=A0AAD1XJF8_EUPCR|nr:unnamed protein product [Moneuplotes crassus]
MINDPKYYYKVSPKARRKSPKRKRSVSKEGKRLRKKKSSKQISFDNYYNDPMQNPAYVNIIRRNHYEDNILIEKNIQLEAKLEEESNKRKIAERERDKLMSSLKDMTVQAKKLETTLTDFEKENIDLYQLLKENNKEINFAKEQAENYYKEINELKARVQQEEQRNYSLQKVIDDQKLILGQQSMEMTQLKITNQAYDLSNKENVRNMNFALERVVNMSNERKKVSNELDNIILRRKSRKSLQGSHSFQQLSSYKNSCNSSQRDISSIRKQHCCQNTNEKSACRMDRSYSDAQILNMNQ